MTPGNQPTFFATQLEFRKWLEDNHDRITELVVGFYKVGSGRPSMTWSESVDQAICYGWIDGVRRSIDGESYCIRFTPRKPSSNWSTINIRKVQDLTEKGLMTARGLAAFNLRQEHRSGIYSYENDEVRLSAEYEKTFRKNKNGWAWFEAMPLSCQKPATRWVMSAKQESTREKRLGELIRDSAAGKKIKQLSY
jgi:uncharacterized protein YdeI (YjbR/CyaY-like superfamily)